ncbi:MAG: NAD(P)/FAD-dependent oxidoreductase [Clostridiales bacterium]|nr:NAD(P)/FAD-dependent oxidoreductase [Clostridiales bacterium]MCF8023506.1 NAD(P)/FAD-dependent oxidoreductase [Clostridiales bacterium]
MASIVVLGAGVAGASLAKSLRKKLDSKHSIKLIEQKKTVDYQASYPKITVGQRRPGNVTRKTNKMHAAGTEIICKKAIHIDPCKKSITLEDGQAIFYDFLAVAAGIDATKADTKELALAGYNLYDIKNVSALHNILKHFNSGKIVLMITSLPIKCPCSIYEYAYMLDEWFRKKGIREQIDISLYTPEKIPFEVTDKKVSTLIEKKLKFANIKIYTSQQFINVDLDNKKIMFTSGNILYDLLLYIPHHRPPQVIQNSVLSDETGQIPVNPLTLSTGWNGVYALGDSSRIKLPRGDNLPMTGEFAHFHAMVTSDNIARKIQKKRPNSQFSGKSISFIQSGAKAISFTANFYKKEPKFTLLPESRFGLAGKWAAEKLWLREHK